MPASPTPITDLRHLAPLARRWIAELLARQLGAVELSYDFYREWNGGWRVRVDVSGARQGWLDFALLATPGGGLLALPQPVPERWRAIYGVNPMVGVVEGFRWALLGTGAAPGLIVLVSTLAALAILVSGAFYFRRMEKNFADVV